MRRGRFRFVIEVVSLPIFAPESDWENEEWLNRKANELLAKMGLKYEWKLLDVEVIP